jgi:alkylhydroperoxidase family enzyme
MNALVTGDLGDVSISTPEGYLLEFVRKVTVESHKVNDADILDLRASGWDEKQIAESIHVAAMFACFNRVANAFGLPPQDLLKHLHDTRLSQREEEIGP